MDSTRPEIVSEDGLIERTFAHAFDAPTMLHPHTDQTRKFAIKILSAHNSPSHGLCSLGTIGLWRTPLHSPSNHNPSRLELFGIFPAHKEGCIDIISSAAFRIMRTHEDVDPGNVFLDYIHPWYPKATVAHLYFAEPGRLHVMDLQEIRMGNLNVRFLEIIPITPAEHDYLLDQGSDALEGILLGSALDLSDLKRSSAI